MSRIFWFLVVLLLFLVPLPGLTSQLNITSTLENSPQIKGSVIDALTKAPVEFAYVSLFRLNETKPIQVTATNSKGEYLFTDPGNGNYQIAVHFMGYTDFKTQPFAVKGIPTVLRQDVIRLEVESIALGAVVVRANNKSPVSQVDKKTIYADSQLSGTGGSASDLLHKIPSITQSPDGKISIHGNSNLLVFINGKPSSLKGNELLQSIPAAEVRKIELITSPSAKYDASGSGGIINLITKKSISDGINGNGMVSTDLLGGYSSDFLLNYKYRKLSFYSGIDRNKRRNEGNIDYATSYLTNLNWFSKTGLQKAERINTGFRAGFDYLPNSTDKISVSGNAGSFETCNVGDWKTMTISLGAVQSPSISNIATDTNNRDGNYGGADVSYEHKFKSPAKLFAFSALWNTVKFDDNYLNLIKDQTGVEQMKQTTLLGKENHNFQVNADYSMPAGKAGNLEFGYQLTVNNENETYDSKQSLLGNQVPNQGTQNNSFNGVIQAGYGTWQFRIGRLNFNAGLRAENLNRELQSSQNLYPLQRFDLYPTFSSSWKIDSTKQIFINYSRRTDQLRTIQLDPLPRWYDFYNVTLGNPNLQNEITDKIALDYLVNLQKLSIATELYFYNTTDKIEIIRSIYRDDIMQNRYENTGSEKTLGVEINTSWKAASWLKVNEKLDFIDSYLDIRLNQTSQKKSYSQWYSVTTADFTISPTTLLELDFSYYGPALTAQSNIDPVYLAGLSFRQTFLNNRLTFTLTGRDVLGIYRRTETISGTDFIQTLKTRNNFPIRFSLSYKFNHYKRDERRIAKSPVIE